MIRIAICDDDISQQKNIEELVHKYFQVHLPCNYEISVFHSALELLNVVSKNRPYDIYLLDIVMPIVNGIELGKALRERDDNAFIIYITSEIEYAIDAFKIHAYHYLIKPINPDDFYQVFDEISDKLKDLNQKFILVKTNEAIEKIYTENIVYVELLKRRLYYHLNDGSEIISTSLQENFKKANETLLEDKRFVLCGASYILNLHQIKQILDGIVIFNNRTNLEPPKRALTMLKDQWYKYWLEDLR